MVPARFHDLRRSSWYSPGLQKYYATMLVITRLFSFSCARDVHEAKPQGCRDLATRPSPPCSESSTWRSRLPHGRADRPEPEPQRLTCRASSSDRTPGACPGPVVFVKAIRLSGRCAEPLVKLAHASQIVPWLGEPGAHPADTLHTHPIARVEREIERLLQVLAGLLGLALDHPRGERSSSTAAAEPRMRRDWSARLTPGSFERWEGPET